MVNIYATWLHHAPHAENCGKLDFLSPSRLSHEGWCWNFSFPFPLWEMPRWNGLRSPQVLQELGLVLVPLVCRRWDLEPDVRGEVGLPRGLTLTLSSSISCLSDLGKVLSYFNYYLFLIYKWDDTIV